MDALDAGAMQGLTERTMIVIMTEVCWWSMGWIFPAGQLSSTQNRN